MTEEELNNDGAPYHRRKFWETTDAKPKKKGFWSAIGSFLHAVSKGIEEYTREKERKRQRQLTVNTSNAVVYSEPDVDTTEEDLRKAKRELEEAEEELAHKKKEMLAVGLILGRYVH